MGLCSIVICDTGTADCESISRVISDVEQNRQPKVVIDRSGLAEEDWNVFSYHLDPPYCIQRAMYPINISPCKASSISCTMFQHKMQMRISCDFNVRRRHHTDMGSRVQC
jgi:hypothetical protein